MDHLLSTPSTDAPHQELLESIEKPSETITNTSNRPGGFFATPGNHKRKNNDDDEAEKDTDAQEKNRPKN